MRILIIRPGALGDALLTFPVIQVLRKRYAQATITLVSNRAVLSLALAWKLVETVDNYEALRWSELFLEQGIRSPELQAQLQATDLVICWLRDSEGYVERNIRATGCRQVIVAPGRPEEGAHEHCAHYLARTIGLDIAVQSPFILASGLTPLEQMREEGQPTAGPRLVALHPGSGGARKCWPVSGFAAVINELLSRNIPVLLLSGPADEERLLQLQMLLQPASSNLLHFLVNAPLIEISAMLAHCRCYLGNDAGITHLAALLGLPTIVLFGASDPRIWSPIGPKVSVLRAPVLNHLQKEVVIATMDEYMH